MQDFKLGVGGAHFKKLRREEGGAKMFGVFRVKNHDFTPTNHIFSNFGSAPAIIFKRHKMASNYDVHSPPVLLM